MPTIRKAAIKKSKRRDRIARWVITLGGVTIIASVLAILLLIVGVLLPLFRAPRSHQVVNTPLPSEVSAKDVVGLGVELDSGQQRSLTAHILSRDGVFTFVDLNGQPRVVGSQRATPPEGSAAKKIRAAERFGGAKYSLLWSDGSVSLAEAVPTPKFDSEGRRSLAYAVEIRAGVAATDKTEPVAALIRRSEEGHVTRVALFPDNRLSIVRQSVETAGLFGESQTKTHEAKIHDGLPGRITAITMDTGGTTLYAGTDNGCLLRWDLDDEGSIRRKEVIPAFPDKRAITSLAMVFGDVSLAVGDDRGGLATWFEVRSDSDSRLRMIHPLEPHSRAVRTILPSQRNKALLSRGGDGTVHLDYMTSERYLMSFQASEGQPIDVVGFSSRGNAVIGLDSQGTLHVWELDDLYPEVSAKSLFGKVFYEGYDQPSYAWQTTGGADFEPKLSLVPLILGTFKGTLYAMLFAVPLALFGAAYTSHFTTPRIRQFVKPTVEIMAAVPSVVLGFLVALWLAPVVERWLLAVLASFMTVPLTFVAFMAVWQAVRRYDWAKRIETGYEFLILVPVLLLGATVAVWVAGPLESWLFGGNVRLWLYETLDTRYDQRNAIIIAFGLGFAVIPIIFSIAEDALSSVPHSMTAASMALGASRWQTLWRVILPSASPGIFAGIMIGFGRAVGETMIVLMATGNTPILDWSPLNGMRTLSANIAVEIPEAPVGGTLYRVLFLCAVILFLLTFMLNTAAELVRQRLRKRYGRF
jgi:phosphate transport system permease protein